MVISIVEIVKDHREKRGMPQDERLGHPFKMTQLAENVFGYIILVLVFAWGGALNQQEYLREQYFLFGFLFGLNVVHLIICGIMDHACHTTFTYWRNLVYVMNFFAMFFNSLTFEIVGRRLPAEEFLLALCVITLFCQLYLYFRWIFDLTYILKIRMFFVKPAQVTQDIETSYVSEDSLNPQSRSVSNLHSKSYLEMPSYSEQRCVS